MNKHVKDVANGANKRKREDDERGKEKKPFDKKKYRLQKYSNKYKVNQWEERRKKAILRTYYKELDKNQRQNAKESGSKNEEESNRNEPSHPKTMSAFHKAKQEFLRKKDEKRKKQEEIQRAKSEREEALKKYKHKKMETFKKLSKKTKKGQPVMKDRMEMLLEKIQRQVSS